MLSNYTSYNYLYRSVVTLVLVSNSTFYFRKKSNQWKVQAPLDPFQNLTLSVDQYLTPLCCFENMLIIPLSEE